MDKKVPICDITPAKGKDVVQVRNRCDEVERLANQAKSLIDDYVGK